MCFISSNSQTMKTLCSGEASVSACMCFITDNSQTMKTLFLQSRGITLFEAASRGDLEQVQRLSVANFQDKVIYNTETLELPVFLCFVTECTALTCAMMFSADSKSLSFLCCCVSLPRQGNLQNLNT